MSPRPKPFSFPGVRHVVAPLPSTFRIADSFPCGFENHSCQRPVLLSLRAGLCAFRERGVHGGGALARGARWAGWAQTRRADDARRGGALARIRVWGLGAARLFYELIMRGLA